MIKFVNILILTIIVSCNSRQVALKPFELKLDSITQRINLKDFKYNNLATFDSIDCWNSRDLKQLTDTILLSRWFGLDKDYLYNFYDIHLLSSQNPKEFILPLIFTQTGSDYGAIVLKLIDTRNGKVITTFELEGGECGGPGELSNGTWVLCGKNSSRFINDSVINNVKVKFYCDSLADDSDMVVDTIKYSYQLDSVYGLIGKQLDSIRIKTQVKNYVR